MQKGGSHSESNVTNPTEGLTKTPSQSQTQSQTPSKVQLPEDASAKGEERTESAEAKPWGRRCAEWYPFLQMVHMQVKWSFDLCIRTKW